MVSCLRCAHPADAHAPFRDDAGCRHDGCDCPSSAEYVRFEAERDPTRRA